MLYGGDQNGENSWKPAEPTQTITVRAEGRTFADLLKDVRTKVSKEELGEVLSIRKVDDKEELQLRLRAGPKVAEVRGTIQNKVEGVEVSEGGRRSIPFTFIIKDLE